MLSSGEASRVYGSGNPNQVCEQPPGTGTCPTTTTSFFTGCTGGLGTCGTSYCQSCNAAVGTKYRMCIHSTLYTDTCNENGSGDATCGSLIYGYCSNVGGICTCPGTAATLWKSIGGSTYNCTVADC